MRIYVAGASAEIQRSEMWIAALRARGHVITHDWTINIREAMKNPAHRDQDLSTEERRRYALKDIEGARSAHLFWLLAPRHSSTGCWSELAIAYERGIRCVVSGDYLRGIFCAVINLHEFDTDELAFSFINSLE